MMTDYKLDVTRSGFFILFHHNFMCKQEAGRILSCGFLVLPQKMRQNMAKNIM